MMIEKNSTPKNITFYPPYSLSLSEGGYSTTPLEETNPTPLLYI